MSGMRFANKSILVCTYVAHIYRPKLGNERCEFLRVCVVFYCQFYNSKLICILVISNRRRNLSLKMENWKKL